MAYQSKLLLRTSPSDVGDMSGHGSYCASPDMIVHSLVKDPKAAFGTSDSYGTDPNERIDQSSKTNTIYTRVKSMQDTAGTVTGYIRMYRARGSLFMNTDQWKNNKLVTPDGKEYVTVTTQNSGEIAVADGVLVVDGTQPNFCMVGIVNDSTQETLPQNFSTYDDFVMWIHSERCVAVRNFSLQTSGVKNDYEALYAFSNPETKARLGSILVQASGLPKGTVYGLSNSSVGMDKSAVFDPDVPDTQQVTDSAFIDGGFSGYVKIYAKLPEGQVWPPEASIITTYWISTDQGEAMAQFAIPANELFLNKNDLDVFAKNNATGKLVRVGFCETKFV